MILKIEGSEGKIKQLARELKVRARRTRLKLSFAEDKVSEEIIENKEQEASKPPVKKETKPKPAPKKKGRGKGSRKAKK